MQLKDYKEKSDKDLLDFFHKDGNNEWLGILLQRYTLLLFGVCMKYLKNEEDAKDSVQQIFLKVINELGKYRVDYFKSWLYMVAKNHCLMHLRKKGVVYELDESVSPGVSDIDKDIHHKKEKKLEQVTEALLTLNKEQRDCVKLFYLDKNSYQQICEKTGYSLMQVKSFIQNGKRNLRIQIERLQQNEQ